MPTTRTRHTRMPSGVYLTERAPAGGASSAEKEAPFGDAMSEHVSEQENAETMLAVFAAVEHRDARRLRDLFDPEAEFHWPPSLPYHRPDPASASTGPAWEETW